MFPRLLRRMIRLKTTKLSKSIKEPFRKSRIENLERRELLSGNTQVLFDLEYLHSYDRIQDRKGTVSVGDDSKSLELQGNNWKAVSLPYNITPDTIIEFDFESDSQGELHGIGIDSDLTLDLPTDVFFAIYGTQSLFRGHDLDPYPSTGVKRYRLPIGEYYQGHTNYLVFMNDHDVPDPTSVSKFSNVVIYEAGIRLSSFPLVPHGGLEQARNGTAEIKPDGRTIELQGNIWESMLFSYDVTSRTRLAFDFTSSKEGELHGIGVDTDLQLSSEDTWFNLYGTQRTFGNRDYDNLGGETTRHYDIPLGEYTVGRINYIVFGNDHDVANPDSDSVFSNLRMYEAGIDFATAPLTSYGRGQDREGSVEIEDDGTTLRMTGNLWKALPWRYEVTPETVLEFEFEQGAEGELHGIGIDNDLELSSETWFNLAGTQSSFGVRDYEKQHPGMHRYVIPIGRYFEGTMEYLVFGNDHDVPNPTGESTFSNVRIYEETENHHAPEFQYDIVVYAGTPAGITSAVQAAKLGKSVVIVEPNKHVGGMMSSGLGLTDASRRNAVGGLSQDFFQRIKSHYDDPLAWNIGDQASYSEYSATADTMWRFEPHVAEAVFEDMLAELFIPVIRQSRLNRESGVEKIGETISSIATETNLIFDGQVFIDASYEGDLMAASGVSYYVGREGNAVYGETLNGVQPSSFLEPPNPIDAYVVPGDPTSGLIPGVHATEIAETGSADHRTQAYNFRLTLTNDQSNMVPFEEPPNYDASQYELYLRLYEAGNRVTIFSFHEMPNHKTDSNGASAFSIDVIGENYNYPEASYEERETIVRKHREYIQGLIWTAATHPRMPAWVRNLTSSYGYAADEYLDNDHFPFQMYVREARRMVSDYVMTEANGRGTRVAPNSIGLANYPMDSHYVQRYADADGQVRGEGAIFAHISEPFPISYQSIVPSVGETNNLIVPVAVSSSHVAFGAIRLEPSYMVLGQSAGTAAVIAIDGNTTVQDVDYAALRAQLIADGQIIDW